MLIRVTENIEYDFIDKKLLIETKKFIIIPVTFIIEQKIQYIHHYK